MRELYERGEIVTLTKVEKHQELKGFKVGSQYKVWCDYEDLVYLETPGRDSEVEHFELDQIKR